MKAEKQVKTVCSVLGPLGAIFITAGFIVVIASLVEGCNSSILPLLSYVFGLGGGVMIVLACVLDDAIESEEEANEQVEES